MALPVAARAASYLDPFEGLGGFVSEQAGEAGKASIWWPHPAVMATRVEGHLDVVCADFLARSLRLRLGPSPTRLFGFHDWSKMTDYDSQARIALTDVAREALPPRSDGTHVLTTSSLVMFGVRASSVFVPDVRVYARSEDFRRALVMVVGRFEADRRPPT